MELKIIMNVNIEKRASNNIFFSENSIQGKVRNAYLTITSASQIRTARSPNNVFHPHSHLPS